MQILIAIEGEIITIVGDSTPLTPMDRSSKQKFSKETRALNDTLEPSDFCSWLYLAGGMHIHHWIK